MKNTEACSCQTQGAMIFWICMKLCLFWKPYETSSSWILSWVLYLHYTLTMTFPWDFPWSWSMNAFGMFSNPSTTCSWGFNSPFLHHSVNWNSFLVLIFMTFHIKKYQAISIGVFYASRQTNLWKSRIKLVWVFVNVETGDCQSFKSHCQIHGWDHWDTATVATMARVVVGQVACRRYF